MTTTPAKKNLAMKLSEIMGLMAKIPKEGFNKAQQYRFVRESDVAEKASQLLSERNIFVTQSVSGWDTRELYRTQSGMTMWLTNVMMEFTFIDGDTGEILGPYMFPGHGADTGDKGIYKAMTGAEKYFLMKTFLISTGDDPEADEKVDKAAAAGAASSGARVRRASQPDVQRGGRTDAATAAQVEEVIRLAKAADLDGKSLRPIIKQAIDKEPPEGARPSEWLGALTGKELATLIGALLPYAEGEHIGTDNNPDTVPGGHVGGQVVEEPVEDDGQQGFAIA